MTKIATFLGYFALNLAFSLCLVACEGTVPVVPAEEPSGTTGGETPAATATGVLDEMLPTRTPVPTATPGILSLGVEEIAAGAGLADASFFGLSTADWINLGLSLLLVALGYLAGTVLLRQVFPSITRRTQTKLDDWALDKIGPDIRWLVVVLALQLATERLTFVGVALKDLLSDIYFLIALAIILQAGWRLIDLVSQWYSGRSRRDGQEEEAAPLIALLARITRALLLVAGLAILLTHFGAYSTAFAVALALGALAISLAARDTIADAIAGFIILVDRPFRIGDRIEIEGEDTWGDVVDIGLRTTRIRTRDNRLVIVPNALIGQNKVSNYTYPDPHYRIQTNLKIAYGTDIELAEQLIVDTVRRMPGVLPDAEIEVLYDEMGDSAMIFCVRWWIESYVDARRRRDQVHRELQKALDAAGIDLPYPTQTLHLYKESELTDLPVD